MPKFTEVIKAELGYENKSLVSSKWKINLGLGRTKSFVSPFLKKLFFLLEIGCYGQSLTRVLNLGFIVEFPEANGTVHKIYICAFFF